MILLVFLVAKSYNVYFVLSIGEVKIRRGSSVSVVRFFFYVRLIFNLMFFVVLVLIFVIK